VEAERQEDLTDRGQYRSELVEDDDEDMQTDELEEVSVNTRKAERKIFWLAYSTRSAKTFQWKRPISTYFV